MNQVIMLLLQGILDFLVSLTIFILWAFLIWLIAAFCGFNSRKPSPWKDEQ